MKKIGIIGGLGPESTLDYYKQIVSSFNTKYSDLAYPEIIIYSANLNEFMGLVKENQWQKMSEWLLEKIFTVHKAGAEFAAIASNTPHVVFDEIKKKSPVPLLSIVEETCKKVEALGLKNVGLMGTKLTMEMDFYKKPFVAKGISVVVPSEQEQQLIHHKLFTEIESGIFKDSTREGFLTIAKRMIDENGIDALILGCTELPLILTKDGYGVPFLNTSAIHCESIINYCIERGDHDQPYRKSKPE